MAHKAPLFSELTFWDKIRFAGFFASAIAGIASAWVDADWLFHVGVVGVCFFGAAQALKYVFDDGVDQ